MEKKSALLLIFLLSLSACAQTGEQETIDKWNHTLCIAFKTVQIIASALAALALIYAGVKYMTSGDDPGAKSGARGLMVQVLAGIVVVVAAAEVVNYLVTGSDIKPFDASCSLNATTTSTSSTTYTPITVNPPLTSSSSTSRTTTTSTTSTTSSTDPTMSTSTTSSTTTSTTAASTREIRIDAYLAQGVDEAAYKSFIEDVEDYFGSQGLTVDLIIVSVHPYSDSNSNDADCPVSWTCPGNADLNMCVGPGEGYFFPNCAVGCNTNSPFGFDTDVGVIAEAHELIHFLGYQDLYCLPSGTPGEGMPQEWLDGDLMGKNPYVTLSQSKMHETEQDIVEFNIGQLNSGGRDSIHYPGVGVGKARMANAAALNVDVGSPNMRCDIYMFSPEYGELCETVQGTIYATRTSDASGMISFPSDWSNGYKLLCGASTYWLPSPVFDDCFIGNGYQTFSQCRIVCQGQGGWCAYAG